MRFTVRKGRRYRAQIHLGMFKRLAGNGAVAAKFSDAGFTGVTVVGDGSERWAFGAWPGEDTTAELPDEIVGVVELPSAT